MAGDEVRFLSKGRFIDKTEAFRKPIMVGGSILPDESLAQTFDSESEFHKWIDQSKISEKLYEIEKTAALLRSRQNVGDHTQSQMRVKASVDRITAELNELAARFNLDPREAGYELFLKATVDRDLLDPPIFDPTIFYEHVGLKGNWLPQSFPIYFPDYRWFSWNDKVSSALVYGAAIMWDDVWFQGARLILYAGFPLGFNLTWYGWNDRVSSSIVS